MSFMRPEILMPLADCPVVRGRFLRGCGFRRIGLQWTALSGVAWEDYSVLMHVSYRRVLDAADLLQ